MQVLFQAFGGSKVKLSQSVLDKNYSLEVKQKYDTLIRTQVPKDFHKSKNPFAKLIKRFSKPRLVDQQHRFDIDNSSQHRREHIPIVDLSLDETEPRAATTSTRQLASPVNSTSVLYASTLKSRKPPVYVDLSDDDSETFFTRDQVLSSTVSKQRNESSSSTSHQRRSNVSSIVPDVTPVNSLKERQYSRPCLQNDAISSIVKKYHESQKQKDSQINDAHRS
jgi:hypothetical protein